MITIFADSKKPSPIPLLVIEAGNDQDEGNQEWDSHAVAAQTENIAEMAEVEVEPLMNGEGEESHTESDKEDVNEV